MVSPSGEFRSLDDLCGHSTTQAREQQAQAFFDRGYELQQSEQYEEAIQAFDEAINLNPDYEEAYAERAIANAALGNFPATMEDYRRVVDFARNTLNTEHA
ncbi:MAG: tetratricopeptide repeat protein [Cyanobacteria bacterium P01_H01_bin.21]